MSDSDYNEVVEIINQLYKRLILSQKAHERLAKKAIKNHDYISFRYHNYVRYKQSRIGVVLTSAQRKQIYKEIKNSFLTD